MSSKTYAAAAVLAVLSALPTALAAPGAAPPIHIPLVRRTGPRALEDYAFAADFVRSKYGFGTVSSKRALKRASSSNIQTTNQNSDSSYFAPVTVGTPGQTFDVILDTGSSDLWLATTQCQQCTPGTPEFNTASSSSFQTQNQPLQISYGSGSVAGTIAQDTVQMGGFTVNSQTLTAVTRMTSGLLQGETGGLMGLAFETIAASQATPFWQTLVSGNQLSAPEMSFWLTRFVNNPNAQPNEPGGAFTLGGTNSTLFTGSIDFQNIPSGVTPSFWLLPLTALTIRGSSVQVPTGTGALSAIDTGTTLIGGPTTAVQNVYSQIPGSTPLTGAMQGFWSIPCSGAINATLSFGGKSWPINDADFALPTNTRNQCLGGIFDLSAGSNTPGGGGLPSGNPQWIIGDTFLKNVYTVFRATPPSVGFAELSAAAGGSSGSPGESSATTSASRSGAPTPSPSGSGGSSSGSSGNSNSSGAHASTSLSLGFATLVSCISVVWILSGI